jgi:hypothetical protein
MTWSLALKNGDLSLSSSNGLDVVSNEEKLVQDLRCNLLEKMGNDDMHPDFGSLLNGGTMPNGTQHNGYIGERDDDTTILSIQSEVTRVVNNYQERTLSRAKTDKLSYGKATLTHGEVLYDLNDVTVQKSLDKVNVMINFTSAANNEQTLEINM